MRINEIENNKSPIRPLTPDQARIDALKQAKDRAGNALKAERNRQKLQKSQKQIAQVNLSSV